MVVELASNTFTDSLVFTDIPDDIRNRADSEWHFMGELAQAYSQITNPEEHAKAIVEIARCLKSFSGRYAEFLSSEDIQRLKVYLQAVQEIIDSNKKVEATISALDDLFASWHERFDEQEMYESSALVAEIFSS